MKRILTAIDNPTLNIRLKEEKEIKIIGKDIPYKEGILEFLEKNKNIDIIIISEKLQGEIETENLIQNINKINKEIKVIYILEKENEEKEKKLKELNIDEIYYNNKINIEKIIKILKEEDIDKEEMKQEIEKLKKIIEKEKARKNTLNKNQYNKVLYLLKKQKNKILKNKIKNNKIIKNRIIKNNINKNRINKQNKNINKYKKIINIIGNKNVGKTTLSLLLGNYLAKKNNKILFLKIKNYKNKKNSKIKNQIKKEKKKIYKKKKVKDKEIKKIKNNIFIKEILDSKKDLKENIKKVEKYLDFFDYLIVDANKIKETKITQEFIKKGGKNIQIVEANLLGIKESLTFIENLEKNKIIKKESLHIVVNRYNFDSLIKDLVNKIFYFSNSLNYIKKEKQTNKIEKNLKKIYKSIIKI